jgi:pSer/pThr/pTyr-binding forkhead associated (FHA) protein
MPNVVIRRGELLERTVPLGTRPLVIGRGSDCDVALDHGSVSRKHVTVAVEDGCVVVRDLGSRNGVYRGRERVTEWRAVPGEQLGIGIFQLEITDTAAAAEECERTRLLPAAPAPAPPPAAPSPEPPPVLRVTGPDGSTSEHAIAGEMLTIGRAADAPLRLDDRMVSRSHARILREGGRWRIVDAGSTNGFSVNGKPVKEADLNPGDEIAIGPFRLVFGAAAARRAPLPQPTAPESTADRPRRNLRLAAVAGGALAACLALVVLLRESPPPAPAPPEERVSAPAPPTSPPELQVSIPVPPPAALQPVPVAAPEPPAPPMPTSGERQRASIEQRDRRPEAPAAAPPPPADRPARPVKPAGSLDVGRLDELAKSGKLAFQNLDCAEVSRYRGQARSIDPAGKSWQAETLARLDDACAGAKQAEDLRRALADAKALQSGGKTAEAIAAYNVVLARFPGQPEAVAALQTLERGERERLARIKSRMEDAEVYDGLGDTATACRLWREVLALEPRELDPTRQKALKKSEGCKTGAGAR